MQSSETRQISYEIVKNNEKIIIGDNVVIKVIRIDGEARVSLAIDAPKDMLVYREELLQSLRK